MNIELSKKQLLVMGVIVLIGVVLSILVLNTSRSGQNDTDDHPKPLTEKSKASSQTTGQASVPPVSSKADSLPDANRIVLGDEQIRAAGIHLETAGPATINTIKVLPGEIHFDEDKTARIVPRVAGVVEAVSARLGQRVRSGDVLATIASATVSDMRSELNTAQKRLALATTTYEREKMLWQEKISAEQDYLQARQAQSEAQTALQNIQQKLRALGATTSNAAGLNRYEIRAPFSGDVTEKHVVLGDAVKEDTTVFQISDLSTVWADITVPAASLSFLHVGDPVSVQVTQGQTKTTGRISYISALVGAQTRTAVARVVLANPKQQWRPGMFVTVEVVIDTVHVPVAVNAEAIQEVNGKPTVFVKTKDGFLAQPVTTGVSDGASIAIKAGMQAGAAYAASGSFVLKAEQGKSSAKEND